MASDDSLDTDPKSPALQYEIVEDDAGRWRLERAHPEMPRTPRENQVVAVVMSVLPTDQDDRPYVPPRVADELDAEPGDTISLVTVAAKWASVMAAGIQEAMRPLVKMVEHAVSNLGEALNDTFSRSLGAADSEERDERLPEAFVEARERKRSKREREREQAGSHYPAEEDHGE